eukprot:COSAG06_NODE_4799_length_3945_cov_8.420376_2_plen_97_part_00
MRRQYRGGSRGRDAATATAATAAAAAWIAVGVAVLQKRLLFLNKNVSYVCPEPVLENNIRALAYNGATKACPHRFLLGTSSGGGCLPAPLPERSAS